MDQLLNVRRPENPFTPAVIGRVSAIGVCTRAIMRIFCMCVAVLAAPALAQTMEAKLTDPLRQPSWNFGGDLFGGFTVVQVTSPNFLTANLNITNLALTVHANRILTHEHGPGFVHGTLEWGVNVVPVEIFWVLGAHYAGGFEPIALRWNLTAHHSRVVPFAGVAGGFLFSPENSPPGNTYQTNFTAAIDVGAHVFVRRSQSLDITGRVFHFSNAYLGPLNPGLPVGLQFAVGYTWY